MSSNLSKFFAGYGSYHNNVVNKVIHIGCVPLIYYGSLAILTHYSVHIDLNLGKEFELNYAVVFTSVVTLVYLYVDFFSGLISSIIYFGFTILSNHLYNKYVGTPDYDVYFKITLAIFFASWIAQFIGHGVYEKRAPALLDNLLQILVAPNFVVIEVLFMLGYKPKAHEEAMVMIEQNIKEFKASKAKKST